MSASALNTNQEVTLNLVTDKIKEQIAANHLHAIAYSEEFNEFLPAEKSVLTAITDKLNTTFTITFSYQQQLHRTKVQKTGIAYGTPIYKVALNSKLSNKGRVCWLQKTKETWVTLLGETMNAALKKAIIAAIESQE